MRCLTRFPSADGDGQILEDEVARTVSGLILLLLLLLINPLSPF